MSKIGKEPVEIPKGVECRIEGNTISVKGPKGTLSLVLLRGVKALLEGNKMMFLVDEKKQGGSTKFQGLYRTLVSNMVKGVTDGFIKKLELKGVGYRAAVQGAKLNLQLGFSHPTLKEIPSGVEVKVENNTLITISGSDKQVNSHRKFIIWESLSLIREREFIISVNMYAEKPVRPLRKSKKDMSWKIVL